MSQKIKLWRKYDVFIIRRDTFYDSIWINKFTGRLIKQGKKHTVEKHLHWAFNALKFNLKQLPGFLFIAKIKNSRPILSSVTKRVGRKYHFVPIPIKPRRQHILSLAAVANYTKTYEAKKLSSRITTTLTDLLASKKNFIVKKTAEHVRHLADSRMYLNLRW